MTDRVLVFSKSGRPLAELDVAVTRSWRDLEYGTAQFSISAGDDKALDRNLRRMNYLVVMSDNGIGDWGGVIWGKSSIDNGVVTINARSAEWLLGTRVSGPYDVFEFTTFEEFFEKLLAIANDGGRLPILPLAGRIPPNVYSNGYAWHYQNLYDGLLESREAAHAMLTFRPVIQENNTLMFEPVVVPRYNARKFRVPLIEGKNLVGVQFEEDAPDLANRIYIFGEPGNWRKVRDVYYQSDDSVREYGLIESVSAESGTDDKFLYHKARMQAREQAGPFLTLRASMVRQSHYPGYAAEVDIQFTTANYMTRCRGGRMTGIVQDIAYNGSDDTLELTIAEKLLYDVRFVNSYDE